MKLPGKNTSLFINDEKKCFKTFTQEEREKERKKKRKRERDRKKAKEKKKKREKEKKRKGKKEKEERKKEICRSITPLLRDKELVMGPLWHDGIRRNDIRHNDTQYIKTRHNERNSLLLCRVALFILLRVEFFIVMSCRVSLCWMSLGCVSWRRLLRLQT